MEFEVSKISEKGDFRTQNQDRVDYAFNKYGQFLAIVCDGMGGHPHGDLAAETGINEFLALFKATNFANFKRHEIKQWLEVFVLKIRVKMEVVANDDEQKLAMGTTLSALLIVDEKNGFTVNVGDSRIYQFDNDKLKQLTIDQNLYNQTRASERRRVNHLYENDHRFNPRHYWKILTSALGPEKNIQIDIKHLKKIRGSFLLTSDGVHDYINPEIIKNVLAGDDALEQKGKKLINLALSGASADNLSLIILEVSGEQNGIKN